MDDSIFSNYDSWFHSDVPSGNYVSYNGRDYTPEFSTNEIFESRDDMLVWARGVGLQNGIIVVIKNSANVKDGKKPRCVLGCERGGKYKPPRHGQPLQRNTGTKKCNCPFELRGKPLVPDGVRWSLWVFNGFHNHEPAEHIDGHEYPCRLNPTESQFVVDMAKSTVPREILSVLKTKNPSNTTGIKSIYNKIYTSKKEERAGLSPTQYVLHRLIEKKYLHTFLSNPNTNEITDIIWVHPESLELSVNFPSVLIIDATYKSNEYRLPLLEVVGITSTMRTYSLMFAYLSNEREDRLTWALGTLKAWMQGRGALLPSVLVSDRDLALINAIESCFPTAQHILCIWHINQCVMKRCSPILRQEYDQFNKSWHSLIKSSSPTIYEWKWVAMCERFKEFPTALNYLHDTWLRPYKERFITAWTSTCMHLGSNSSQRVESAHARLKMYLGGTMSSLQRSFDKIEKMLTNQFGQIKKSFEKSITIPRHRHLHDNIYDEVRCRISLFAMEKIHIELESADSDPQPQLAGDCNCQIRLTHGLPCMHDLACYRALSIPIPLKSIHTHWKRLSMRASGSNDSATQPDRTYIVVDRLHQMDPQMREHMIDRFIDMSDPSQSTVRAPSYNTEHRGRPAGREEQSRRRMHSFPTAPTSEARGRGRGREGRGTESVIHSESRDAHFIGQLPKAFQPYISHIIDVQGDGHCGFRAIAAQVGYTQDGWAQVRHDLIEEIEQNKALYDRTFLEDHCADQLLFILNWFHSWAPPDHWMEIMNMGVVIASRYNLVLHVIDTNAYGCFTHLPLRSPPVPLRQRREIAIAHLPNHFVQVFLKPHCPLPPIPTMWWKNSYDEAKDWHEEYLSRMGLWHQVMGTTQGGFGGNID